MLGSQNGGAHVHEVSPCGGLLWFLDIHIPFSSTAFLWRRSMKYSEFCMPNGASDRLERINYASIETRLFLSGLEATVWSIDDQYSEIPLFLIAARGAFRRPKTRPNFTSSCPSCLPLTAVHDARIREFIPGTNIRMLDTADPTDNSFHSCLKLISFFQERFRFLSTSFVHL